MYSYCICFILHVLSFSLPCFVLLVFAPFSMHSPCFPCLLLVFFLSPSSSPRFPVIHLFSLPYSRSPPLPLVLPVSSSSSPPPRPLRLPLVLTIFLSSSCPRPPRLPLCSPRLSLLLLVFPSSFPMFSSSFPCLPSLPLVLLVFSDVLLIFPLSS